MGQPHVLVIDDSEAILAFTRSVLASHYAVSTAKDGKEGLSLAARLQPDIVLLDLSMPEMDGEQVLAHMKADPKLEAIPVVIISSEKQRGEACLSRGAIAFLAKPVRAEELAATVHRALETARAQASRGSLTILPITVGPLELGIPLAHVRHVIPQIATRPLPSGPSYLSSFIELFGEPICVLDLATRLGVEHTEPVLERKLVVVEADQIKLAACVDRVRDPEEIAPANVQPIVPESATAVDPSLLVALHALVKTPLGPMPVLRAHALLSRGLVSSLSTMVKELTAVS